jgi:phosphatidylserine/phosphatidylglycerophosphate/cardiolipin synthase-like enzyme
MANLPKLISAFVSKYPTAAIEQVCDLIDDHEVINPYSTASILGKIVNPAIRYEAGRILESLVGSLSETSPRALSLAIRSAGVAYYSAPKTETAFVWTGPTSGTISARRTEQVLLELIENSKSQLILVSFAIYQAQNILDAISRAIARGVEVSIIIEDNQKKISTPAIKAFSKNIFRQAQFFHWPENKRPVENGLIGSLHAKIAIADNNRLFITSANLTQFAMEMNIEAGILISSGELPRLVHEHLTELSRTMFEKISF